MGLLFVMALHRLYSQDFISHSKPQCPELQVTQWILPSISDRCEFCCSVENLASFSSAHLHAMASMHSWSPAHCLLSLRRQPKETSSLSKMRRSSRGTSRRMHG